MIRKLLRTTPGGKVGAVDGLNLFFGALLGANLGTMQALELRHYVTLVVLLAGTVMVVRMISTSERRTYTLVLVGVYALILGVVLMFLPPKGMSPDDLHRLAATLAIWVLCILGAELSPVEDA
jgi:hypothetical protein